MWPRGYLNSALWIVPLVALLMENVVIRLVFMLHSWLDWIPWFGTTVAGATEALNAVESLANCVHSLYIWVAADCYSGC